MVLLVQQPIMLTGRTDDASIRNTTYCNNYLELMKFSKTFHFDFTFVPCLKAANPGNLKITLN